MLIICNGAFKSGSTWVYLIAQELYGLKGVEINPNPDQQYLGKNNKSFLFNDTSIQKIAKQYAESADVYLSKAHLIEESSYEYIKRELKDAKVLFVSRNLEDAILSHYHHVNNLRKKKQNFDSYYWSVGRYKAKEILSFEKYRVSYLPTSCHITYEGLKSNFDEEVSKLAKYLGLEISESEIEVLREKTSIDTLRDKAKKGEVKQYGGASGDAYKMFRSGKVGEAKEVMTEKHLADLDKIKSGKYGVAYNLYYYLAFTLRRKFFRL